MFKQLVGNESRTKTFKTSEWNCLWSLWLLLLLYLFFYKVPNKQFKLKILAIVLNLWITAIYILISPAEFAETKILVIVVVIAELEPNQMLKKNQSIDILAAKII